MRVHLVQLDTVWEDKPANYRRVESLLDDADVAAGDLVVLPEMFDTGFSLNVEATADRDGATDRFLSGLAKRFGATVQGGSTARRDDGWGLNRAPVFDPHGVEIAKYDKLHPFSFGREPERFVGGDRIQTYLWRSEDPSLRVCPAVCYDLRFAELFRLGLTLGAEAFAIGANWPAPRAAHWRTLLIARAIENQAFVFGVNRCGDDPHLRYAGGSMVVSPTGEILAEAAGRETTLSVEIEPEAARAWRAKFPAVSDPNCSGASTPTGESEASEQGVKGRRFAQGSGSIGARCAKECQDSG